MLDFIYPVILIVCLLSILWLFLKPKKVHEVHYLIHKNKQKILDISKAYDLYAEASHLVIAQFSDALWATSQAASDQSVDSFDDCKATRCDRRHW